MIKNAATGLLISLTLQSYEVVVNNTPHWVALDGAKKCTRDWEVNYRGRSAKSLDACKASCTASSLCTGITTTGPVTGPMCVLCTARTYGNHGLPATANPVSSFNLQRNEMTIAPPNDLAPATEYRLCIDPGAVDTNSCRFNPDLLCIYYVSAVYRSRCGRHQFVPF